MTARSRLFPILGLLIAGLAACQLAGNLPEETPNNGEDPSPLELAEWGTPSVVVSRSHPGIRPRIVMDQAGNAIAVWTQYGSSGDGAVWASRFTPSAGWGTAGPVGTIAGDAWAAGLAMDGEGNAVVVFSAPDEVEPGVEVPSVWARRSTTTGAWADPVQLETGNALTYPGSVAGSAAGSFVAVWHQSDAGTWSIWASRYTKNVGWDAAQLVETADDQDAKVPSVPLSDNAEAVAAWWQDTGSGYAFWANRYTPSGGWGATPQALGSSAYSASIPGLTTAIDPQGNAAVVWPDRTGSHVWCRRYAVGTGWLSAEQVDQTGLEQYLDPAAGMDAHGNLLVAWHQLDTYGPPAQNNIWARWHLREGGWQEPVRISDPTNAKQPRIAVDPSGNAVAVWLQYDGSWFFDVWASRYIAGRGWLPAERVSAESPLGEALDPMVAISPAAMAITTWSQLSDATGSLIESIWANVLR